MDNQNGVLNPEAQLLTLILSENQSNKCVRLVKERSIRGGLLMIGRGTVSNAVLNLLGIKSQRKDIIKLLVESEKAKEIMDCLDHELQLTKPGHGIAFTTPVLSVFGQRGTAGEQTAQNTVKGPEGEYMFKKLTVIVDRGISDDVMDIARKAGAKGGTILHGRGAGAEIATNLFGVEIEPEKELVIILLPNDIVDKVANALTEELGLNQPSKGILFIEPVLETRGLFEMRGKEE